MIFKFLNKIPAGIMLIPLLIGSLINTFCPQILQIGGLTTAAFTNAGAATILGVQLFCLGTTLHVKDMPKVLKRGGTLLISKFVIGAALGIAVGLIFGKPGFMGLTTLALICAVTNSNGSIYLSLVKTYGDDTDAASVALLALNDGPFLTLLALGTSGMASIPFMALVATLVPMLLGMLLGNLDKKVTEYFAPAADILIPFVGLTLGTGINMMDIVKGGLPGVLLGLISTFVGGAFICLCDRLICKRPGYAAWAVATTAGNAVAVPAAVALVDPAWAPYQAACTSQVAGAVVVTALLAPLMTTLWVKKFGSPQCPLNKEESLSSLQEEKPVLKKRLVSE